jgi:hypothetical protein
MLGRDVAVVKRSPRLLAKRLAFVQHGPHHPQVTCYPLAWMEKGSVPCCMELHWATDGTLGVIRENS